MWACPEGCIVVSIRVFATYHECSVSRVYSMCVYGVYIYINQTTNWCLALPSAQPFVYPYDLGAWENIKVVFGPNVLLWWLPTPVKGVCVRINRVVGVDHTGILTIVLKQRACGYQLTDKRFVMVTPYKSCGRLPLESTRNPRRVS